MSRRRRPLPLASTHPDWLRFLDEKRREAIAMALAGINYNPEPPTIKPRTPTINELERKGRAVGA